MKKLCVFVEGHTELLFVTRLIEEIADKNSIIIEHKDIIGGNKIPRKTRLLKVTRPNPLQKYWVRIIDCHGDNNVKQRILEEHENLTQSGFSAIIGIRDVRPDFSREEVPQLEKGLNKYYIKTSLVPVYFILSVMEIEAWYLADTSHFLKIDPALTPELLIEKTGLDPRHDDFSLRDIPQDDMENCYQIAGKHYVKGSGVTEEALDIGEYYVNLPGKIPSLAKLICHIESFLAS